MPDNGFKLVPAFQPSLFQATLHQARREFTTSGISRPFFPIAIFSPIAPVDCQSHDHGATNPTQANSPPLLPCPCQIEAIPQSFSHLGLRLSLPASAIRLRNDQKAQFTHIKLDRQALHSPRDDLHKICFYSQLTTGFHSSKQGHKILVASIHYSFIYT